MIGWENRVARTIENPIFGVCRDVDYENRCVYYRLMKGGKEYLKVIVEFDEVNSGHVVTAYTTDSPKSGEKLIWPESKD
jgi:hypothetical protein